MRPGACSKSKRLITFKPPSVRYSKYSFRAAHLRKSVVLLLQITTPPTAIVIQTKKKTRQRSEFSQSFPSYDMCHINTVWVVHFLCILIFHTSAIQYTHDWAIEVDGGQEEADLVAKDTGCVNQGKNICFFNDFFVIFCTHCG